MTKAARYRLLAVLYGSQVIPFTFFIYALPAVLRDQGASLRLIGLVQLLAVTWVAKAAWAPLVDRHGWGRLGHYRGWLLVLRALTMVAILTLGPVDPVKELPLLVAIVGVVAVLSATQDIAADATAVRLLAPSERGVGNGIQRAGGYFGYLVGAGGVLVVHDRLGWPAALAVLVALTAVPLPPLLRYREPQVVPTAPQAAASWRTVGSFFGRPGATRWTLVVLPLYLVGLGTAYPLVTPMLVDAGWPLDRIGAVSMLGGGLVAMLASLAGGVAVTALGRRPALVVFGLVQVVAVAGLLPLARGAVGMLTGLAAVALLNLAFATAGTAVSHGQHGLVPARLGRRRLHRPGLLRPPAHAARGQRRPRPGRRRRLLGRAGRRHGPRAGRRGRRRLAVPPARSRWNHRREARWSRRWWTRS